MIKSKVFIGTINTANQAKGFAEALRGIGLKADFWSSPNSVHPFGYGSDKLMKFLPDSPPPFKIFSKNIFYLINNYIIRIFYFIRFLLSYNVFIFISPSTILRNYKDLPILKFLKKKIVFVFCGCTERDPAFDKNNPDWICNRCKDEKWKEMFLCNDLDAKKRLVQYFEEKSNFIISQDDSSVFLKEKEPIWFYIFSPKPKTKNYLKKFKEKKIKIVHFPSNSLLKQSHIIIPILKRLEKENLAEIILKDGIWSHEKILSTLGDSHILVDQFAPGYATICVEAFSRGCVVLNRNDDWFVNEVPESPVYKTSADTLYDDLVYLIEHREVLKEYAEKSIKFYYKYHTPEVLGKFYKEKLGLQ